MRASARPSASALGNRLLRHDWQQVYGVGETIWIGTAAIRCTPIYRLIRVENVTLRPADYPLAR
jgi:hypothetical protein